MTPSCLLHPFCILLRPFLLSPHTLVHPHHAQPYNHNHYPNLLFFPSFILMTFIILPTSDLKIFSPPSLSSSHPLSSSPPLLHILSSHAFFLAFTTSPHFSTIFLIPFQPQFSHSAPPLFPPPLSRSHHSYSEWATLSSHSQSVSCWRNFIQQLAITNLLIQDAIKLNDLLYNKILIGMWSLLSVILSDREVGPWGKGKGEVDKWRWRDGCKKYLLWLVSRMEGK